MSFAIRLTREALENLRRIEGFLVELALQHGDFDRPARAVGAIRRDMRILETNPYACRRAGSRPLERELRIPSGGSGFVALFEIISEREVAVCALRRRREDDYR